ncbi:MAG TPA: hypothetical protein VIT88_08430, partial [Pyrinomonadaceae bacterium]
MSRSSYSDGPREGALRSLRAGVISSIAIAVLVFSFSTRSGLTQSQSNLPDRQLTAAQKANLPMAKGMSVSIRNVARVLNEASVPIEAGLLFTAYGRATLHSQLNSLPDMQISKTHSG